MSTSQPAAAFLSVRLPEATRDRLKAAAVERGETVQALVGELVERFLAEQDRRAPDLATVVNTLRGHQQQLKERGVAELWVFGSVARGEAHVGSDVDLFAVFDPAAALSLVGVASLRVELSDVLGVTADLVERDALHPTVRAAAEREAVRVL